MGEFKGTKGKWELEVRENRCCINQGDNKAICDVWGEGVSSMKNDEMKANAKLIACAPEMLEFLLECLDTFTCVDLSDKELKNRIQSLIKKATEL